MNPTMIYGIVGSGCFVLGAVVTYFAYRAIYRKRLSEGVGEVQSTLKDSYEKRDAAAKEALAERDRSIDKLSKANREFAIEVSALNQALAGLVKQDGDKAEKLASAYEEMESLKHQLAPKRSSTVQLHTAKKQVKAKVK